MRYSKKAPARTLAMLMDDAIPRRSDGALGLCADCQRWMWFSGSYLNWLSNQLLSLASVCERLDRIPKWVAEMRPGEKREWRAPTAAYRERVRDRIRTLSAETKRNFRVRTWTHGLIEVWRLP